MQSFCRQKIQNHWRERRGRLLFTRNTTLYFTEVEANRKFHIDLKFAKHFVNKCLIISEKIVSIQFMKKYIHIAKAIKPKLTKAATDLICEEYAKLRSFDNDSEDIARVS